MRLGLLAHDLTSCHVRGIPRYTAGLAKALADSGQVDVVFLSRMPLNPLYDHLPGERFVWWGLREVLWEQWDLPRMAARLKLDVLHGPSNRGLCAFSPCPTVLTRHDAIERMFPPDFPGSLRSRFRMLYSDEISMRRASAVATVSHTSKRDIVSVWKVSESRVVVAGEGVEEHFFRQPSSREIGRVKDFYRLSKPYILYLGGFDLRKNVPSLVHAYALIGRRDLDCVLAGPTRGELPAIRAAIEQHDLQESVHILGEIREQDVPALYASTSCFVYPSRYEGFGLQAVEAMAQGVPLIVSDGGALPEITGDAALCYPAGDSEELARCLQSILGDRSLRASLVERGLKRAPLFRWESVVSNYISLYQRLIRGDFP